ncbi:unnamed protein product, partial [Pocillopora meandrina]
CSANRSKPKVLPAQQIQPNRFMVVATRHLSTRFFQCLKITWRRNWRLKPSRSSKIDKEVVQLKYKGNQKQYELNAKLDSIIESIETESERGEPNLPLIKKYSQEARELIRKRQKRIKIADKSKDGWQVVAEYESDELVSDSEDEKRLKKARETASRKRRQKDR